MAKKNPDLEKEVKYWTLLGRTMPFVGLALIILCNWFAKDYIGFAAVAIIAIWVAVAVYWWWWALARILWISKKLMTSTQGFAEVKQDIADLKDDISNRKRTK